MDKLKKMAHQILSLLPSGWDYETLLKSNAVRSESSDNEQKIYENKKERKKEHKKVRNDERKSLKKYSMRNEKSIETNVKGLRKH